MGVVMGWMDGWKDSNVEDNKKRLEVERKKNE